MNMNLGGIYAAAAAGSFFKGQEKSADSTKAKDEKRKYANLLSADKQRKDAANKTGASNKGHLA